MIKQGFRKVDSDRWEFANEGFLRGQKHLLKGISRRKPAHGQGNQQVPQVQSASVGSCVEVGKFGIEEDVEQLKRDKNDLMQELVRLRQQQQTTDNQLQTVGQRVHTMEQRQQHMMSFLAKAMQSPGFLTQLVHQQNDSSRRISGVNKKRRLPKQEDENFVGKCGTISPDGQIVKYQPLMNEAAKAMLRQILKINASSRLEPTINNSNNFLIDNVPSASNVLDSCSSSSRLSGVTLSEVLSTTSSQSYAESRVPVGCPSPAISESKSPASVAPLPDANMLDFEDVTGLPDFSEIQGLMEESTVNVPELTFDGSKTEDMGYMNTNMDTMPGFIDGAINVSPDGFSSDPDVDVLLDEIPKLPSINDVFWEQFLSTSPLTGDSDEINSSATEGGVVKEHELQIGRDGGWDKTHHLHHLTEQMGLLASGSTRG